MKNKKQTILMIVSLIIIGGLFTGCNNTTKKTVVNTTTTQVQTQKVKDKQEALRKELQPLLLNFADTQLTFDYTKYTAEDYKKVKDFLTEDIKANEVDQKFNDTAEHIKKLQGIAKVESITIDNVKPYKNAENTYIIGYTVKQYIEHGIQDGKDLSGTYDSVKIQVAVKKINDKWLIDSYKIEE